ncbi:MAG: double-strand break repair protein AddB [Rhodomicrobium sp.]
MRSGAAAPESGPKQALQGTILKCPAQEPFIPALAAAILDGFIWNGPPPEPHELPTLTVYLPTRSAIEPLKLAFISLAPNGATFLPRIFVLGEAEPIEIFTAFGVRMNSTERALKLFADALAVPAAFGAFERQIVLSALVSEAMQGLESRRLAPQEQVFTSVTAASAFSIAGEIAALIDEAGSEGADLSRIARLDITHSSGGEQLSLQLLKAVLEKWRAHKVKAKKVDREERRTRLMAIEAEFIHESTAPVIIAGSTGSVAATASLMEAALTRKQSAIVLYGLDETLDRESWAELDQHPEHPQHGLHHLLQRLDIKREDIRPLSGYASKGHSRPTPQRPKAPAALKDRALFISEALRPASSTAKWAAFIPGLRGMPHPAPALCIVEASNIQEEAEVIGLILRESLETPDQTAALVTPSTSLISRVGHVLAGWGVAGDPTANANSDCLAARVVACAATGDPAEFVELVREAGANGCAGALRAAELCDLGALRQMWRPATLQEMEHALRRAQNAVASGEARHPALKRIEAAEWDAARTFASQAIEALAALTSHAEKQRNLSDWVAAHARVMSDLNRLGLAANDADDEKATVLEELEQAPKPRLALDLTNYAGFFSEAVSSRAGLPLSRPHPRVSLWTPLDARLQTADVLVLGGLNEGCWPYIPGPDPWLSPANRKFCGLAPLERRVGQSAQDFMALAASAPRVFLTRSKKINGTVARPSRWLIRMKTLAAGTGRALEADRPWLTWAASRHGPKEITPVPAPQPKPAIAARPRRLSVTAIEKWFANPYAIYARHILGLEPLRGAREAADVRDKGTLYHAALHGFFRAYPSALPANAAAELLKSLDKAAIELGFNLASAPFWRPRFARFASWLIETETGRRQGVEVIKSEVSGKLVVEAPEGPFEITARADRIDRFSEGAVRIYDFKTSANTARIAVRRGAPQLGLEGLLAREGAFAGVKRGFAPELFYIVATGGEPPGEIVPLKPSSTEAIQAAHVATLLRIARFDEASTPYAYESRGKLREKSERDPYAHLARVKEWAAGAENAEGEDE